MFHICVMGGYEGRLNPDKRIYFTLFGGAELVRPTVARQLLAFRQQRASGVFRAGRHFFFTICGGIEINSPTLAEEFIDLRELVQSGELKTNDWEACLAEFAHADISFGSLTLMGGFSEVGVPSESNEIDSLALNQHLGCIPESAVCVLRFGIGQRGAERRATVRKALATAI